MQFWLGTHEVRWLSEMGVPLFISHTRLRERSTLPRAVAPWALDSGGFTEVGKHRGYRWTVDQYVAAVARYGDEIGQLAWAAPMDWMCEPDVLAETGLTVREHQERTVANYLTLRGRGPFIPVLQGWTLPDYERCLDLYAEAGVDLAAEPLVGVGSVCRRQSTDEIGRIMVLLHGEGISVHGFGVKKVGLRRYGGFLASADSMAWSTRGRQAWLREHRRMCDGDHRGGCVNCSTWALRWRDSLPRVQMVLEAT